MGNLDWAITTPLEKERGPADSQITQRRLSRPSAALLPWSPWTGARGSAQPKLKEHRLRSPFSGDDDLVFPNDEGGFADPDNMVKRKFKPALVEAKIAHVPWHALRHFAVSTWIEQGLSPKEVQTYARHASLATTMDRYGHLFPTSDHRKNFNAVAKDIL
jgi:integrase